MTAISRFFTETILTEPSAHSSGPHTLISGIFFFCSHVELHNIMHVSLAQARTMRLSPAARVRYYFVGSFHCR
jgi:hypothetical protein